MRVPIRLMGASLALLAASSMVPAPARGDARERAESYLLAAQGRDGGFGAARGEPSDPMFTAWSALALAASGHNPREANALGRSAVSYLRSQADRARDPGALARTLLVYSAAGAPDMRSGGRSLSAELLERRRPDGSFDGLVNITAFTVLALIAAGEPPESGSLQDAARWLIAIQNADGGFSFLPGARSSTDDTGAVLQALAATRPDRPPAIGRAVQYLLAAQNPDSGFGSAHSSAPGASNSMSTSWAVQGFLAAGYDPNLAVRRGRTPLDYLRALQQPDGSLRYSRSIPGTPVWATAQSLLALEGRPFPLPAVPLAERPSTRAPVSAPLAPEVLMRHNHKTRSAPRHLSVPRPVAVPPDRDALRGRGETEIAARRSRLAPVAPAASKPPAYAARLRGLPRARPGARQSSFWRAWVGALVATTAVAALAFWRRRRDSAGPAPREHPSGASPTPPGRAHDGETAELSSEDFESALELLLTADPSNERSSEETAAVSSGRD